MLNKTSLLLASALVALSAGAAAAEPSYGNSSQNQPAYSNGYNYGYDDGVARRERNAEYRNETYRQQIRYQRGDNYYGSDCGSNATAGTVIGAIAGGVIGNQFGQGSGRTAATLGGVILGGLAGNSIARDMDCNDRRSAMSSYRDGFAGRVGQRHSWRNADNGNYGSMTPTRQYARNGETCRDYRETSYRGSQKYDRTGTACRQSDGNWYTQ